MDDLFQRYACADTSAAGRLRGRSSTESFWRTARFASGGHISTPHRY
jgi:hypothetical protein